jgi:hypothetical protein
VTKILKQRGENIAAVQKHSENMNENDVWRSNDSINSTMKATQNVETSQLIHDGKALEDTRCYMRQVVWVVRSNGQVLIGALIREPINIIAENLGGFKFEIYRNGMGRSILRSRGPLGAFEMLGVLTRFNNGGN